MDLIPNWVQNISYLTVSFPVFPSNSSFFRIHSYLKASMIYFEYTSVGFMSLLITPTFAKVETSLFSKNVDFILINIGPTFPIFPFTSSSSLPLLSTIEPNYSNWFTFSIPSPSKLILCVLF